MTRPKYVASCSGGKDSVATLLLAAQHNEPLDEAVFSEVMFDKDTSGEAVAQGKNPSAAASLRLNASRSTKTLAIDPLISKKQITQTGPSE